jgi:hypothetical protein
MTVTAFSIERIDAATRRVIVNDIALVAVRRQEGDSELRVTRGDTILLVRQIDLTDAAGRRNFRDALENLGAAVPDDVLVALNPTSTEDRERTPTDAQYVATDEGFVHLKLGRGGLQEIPITNFSARVVRQLLLDDGQETHREYEMEATLGAQTRRFRVPSASFNEMDWVERHLGAAAVIYAGAKDHTRVAIKCHSTKAPETRVFTRTGWHTENG